MAQRKFCGIAARSKDEAFFVATITGKLKAMEELLADGANLDALCDGRAPLHQAVEQGKLKCIEFLIAAGADLNLLDSNGSTPLMNACHAGKVLGSKAAMLLLAAGADPMVVRSDEMTALKFAVDRSPPEILQALLDAGVEVDGPPGTDQTALMLAARKNNVESLKVLIANGADPTIPCGLPWAEGRTAEGLAKLELRTGAINYLRSVREGASSTPQKSKAKKAAPKKRVPKKAGSSRKK